MMNKVLITGATGFIGKALINRLVNEYHIKAVVRESCGQFGASLEQVILSTSLDKTNWLSDLEGVDTIIHLAARVHVMNEIDADPLEAFRKINTKATLNLARQASMLGVRRFIYLSSIKVNGEVTVEGSPFVFDDTNIPTDPYGISKYEAEQGLREIADTTGIEVVIIRPPLVYGPDVKANFNSMMNWLNNGIPLPLGGIINNKRSLLALDNLTDLVSVCIEHPSAANQTFLVSDDDDLSTADLLQRLSNALGKPSRLLPVPSKILEIGALLVGKQDILSRLCGSLQVDIDHTKKILGWKPLISIDAGLQKTADAFLKHKNK